MNDDDPGKLCEYLENQEGHCLATPCSKSTLCMCGCCVQEFQGRLVASYVARGSTAPISVVVLRYPPKGLGMTPNTTLTAAGHAVWQASCGPCNMACVCIADTSHCAIGHVPQEELVAVLNSLVK
ncbi:MAG: hypothetical protein A2Y76_04155 [Planctomycetes bacterium RBG_13_60_9]|nr:MAG: hypothetical protein A2Y76_04155 [Planctomycetes bacterium RBG_13_60_9]